MNLELNCLREKKEPRAANPMTLFLFARRTGYLLRVYKHFARVSTGVLPFMLGYPFNFFLLSRAGLGVPRGLRSELLYFNCAIV